MSSIDISNEMDPAARAIAEIRAREAGVSLGRWLETLVYERALPTSTQCHWSFRGMTGRSDRTGAGFPLFPDLVHDTGETHDSLAQPPALEALNPHRTGSSSEIHVTAWSALQTVTTFPPTISHAAILLSAAFAEADVEFRPPPHRSRAREKAPKHWYHALVDTCLHRSHEVRTALVHPWSPSGRAERLWGDAFYALCDLTPARHELLILFGHDRGRASVELAKHLDLATRQFQLSAHLLAEVEDAPIAEPADERRFAQARVTLLDQAGGGVSLTEGARLLGITRQALHKRIKAGSALGMMDGDEIVLPCMQWVQAGDRVEFVPGLSEVVKLFGRAGGWSALQFLIDPDPNLGQPPVEALAAGNVAGVTDAARAYLGLDEG